MMKTRSKYTKNITVTLTKM